LTVKSLEELSEVLLSVMWAGGCLGVVLDGKNGVLAVPNAFYGAIIEVKVGDFERFRARHTPRIASNREPVVLGSDKHLPRLEIANWMVAAAMPVGKLHRLGPKGEPQQLVT
jgi:hypothetical protein